MAVKYFCDGCDRETSTKRIQVVIMKAPDTVTLQQLQMGVTGAAQGVTTPPIVYDLCGGCEESLKNQANPKSWARPKPPEPRIAQENSSWLSR